MREQAFILIIDDDGDYRASTRALLEGEGFEVAEADSGPAGLAAIRQRRPDLVVLDVMMDGLEDGYSVNQAIKFGAPGGDAKPIPVVMASSVGLDPASLYGWIGDTSPITPDAYLTKPLDIPVFLDTVQRLLAK